MKHYLFLFMSLSLFLVGCEKDDPDLNTDNGNQTEQDGNTGSDKDSAKVYSGICGANMQWRLDTETGLFTITGTGALRDYHISDAPWYKYRDYLKTVEIADGVTSIGEYAFYRCSRLTSVTIPNSVTEIGGYAFEYCEELTSITIPNSVTAIGNYAFSDCSGLVSITIPNSVTAIGSGAFAACSGLVSVTIPNSVTTIRESAFSNCSGLVSVTIPNSVTAIGSGAFYYCYNLTSVTIPNSVTAIGSGAFSYCSRLTSVIIPNSVTYIGDRAFRDCSRLTSVTIDIATPLNISSDVFSSSNCTLYVPAGSVDLYKAAWAWKEFRQILPIDKSSVEAVDADAPK